MAKKNSSNITESAVLKKVLQVFNNDPFSMFNYKQVSARIAQGDKAMKVLVKDAVTALAEQNMIVQVSRGKYKMNPLHITIDKNGSNCVKGTIDMKQTGKAYLIPDEGLSEDIRIDYANVGHALHGDKVLVYLFPKRKSKRLEGRVVEILERAKTQFVGTLKRSRSISYCIPDSRNMRVNILIPNTELNGAEDGKKVLVEMTEWSPQAENPFGKVVLVLGDPGNNDVEMNSILSEFDFPLVFPQGVLDEAEQLSGNIDAEELKRRRDFRDVFTCTIDPADAKDFDDAVSLRALENGLWEVGVHIADVSYYVRPNTAIDDEAYSRGTSVYLVDRTIPMLPEKLCNDVCSLRPNEDKLCFSAVFVMDEFATIKKRWFGKTVIHSNRRFTYEEAQQIIETKEGDFAAEILMLDQLAKKLRAERMKKGSINFSNTEVKFRLDENAKPIGVYIKESKDANKLIEDFMLLANREVAASVARKGGKAEEEQRTFVYRVHDKPLDEKIEHFNQFLEKIGYSLQTKSRKSLVNSMNKLFEDTRNKGEHNIVEQLALRTMAKAVYSTSNIGHYGLAFAYYTHFTSPIRRYPDLMVHRLLENYLHGGTSPNKAEYEAKCVHSSNMEQKAVDAERASIKYKQAEFLADKIGEVFDGLISGVSKWGIYVEIKENKCEGMVPLKRMLDDFYYIDEDNYCMIGQRKGKVYRLGDEIRIRIADVDLQKRQLNFDIVE